MTLAEVKAIRDKYYNELLAEYPMRPTHSIGDASYSHDEHRSNLLEQLKFWDNLYNVKLSGGTTLRMNKKSV